MEELSRDRSRRRQDIGTSDLPSSRSVPGDPPGRDLKSFPTPPTPLVLTSCLFVLCSTGRHKWTGHRGLGEGRGCVDLYWSTQDSFGHRQTIEVEMTESPTRISLIPYALTPPSGSKGDGQKGSPDTQQEGSETTLRRDRKSPFSDLELDQPRMG